MYGVNTSKGWIRIVVVREVRVVRFSSKPCFPFNTGTEAFAVAEAVLEPQVRQKGYCITPEVEWRNSHLDITYATMLRPVVPGYSSGKGVRNDASQSG